MRNRIACVAAGVLLTACATPPNNIKPIAAAPGHYAGWACQQLADEAIKINSGLGDLTAAQSRTSSNDVAGVLILGLPVGSMGDAGIKKREADIARMKGELDAIQKARGDSKCG